MLVIQVSLSDFRDEMSHYDHNFSEFGLMAIFNYFANFDQPQDFSPDDIILDFAEMSCQEIAETYAVDMRALTESEAMDSVRDYLASNTTIIGESGFNFTFIRFKG